MHSNPYYLRAAFAAVSTRRLPAFAGMPAPSSDRTPLPVLSNRAFVAAWAARRNRLAAAAQVARVR